LQRQFFTDHFQSIREESYILKEEGEQCDKATRTGHLDLAAYMDGVQRKINRKLEIFMELKRKADFLSAKVHESNSLGKMIGEFGSFD